MVSSLGCALTTSFQQQHARSAHFPPTPLFLLQPRSLPSHLNLPTLFAVDGDDRPFGEPWSYSGLEVCTGRLLLSILGPCFSYGVQSGHEACVVHSFWLFRSRQRRALQMIILLYDGYRQAKLFPCRWHPHLSYLCQVRLLMTQRLVRTCCTRFWYIYLLSVRGTILFLTRSM